MNSQLSVTTNSIVGNVLSRIRKSKGYNQDFVSNLMNISISGLSKIESGATALSIEQLLLLSKIYEVNAVEILTEIENIIDQLTKANILVINKKENPQKKGDNINLESKSVWWLDIVKSS